MNWRKRGGPGRYLAPIACAVFMAVLMLGMIWLMVWVFETDPAGIPPAPVAALLLALPAAVIVGVIWALIQRLRELGQGEEEDAKRY
ncbi:MULTISPECIES: hypothetical protein [unclassified Oscillibacter]|uniref:hypothetical protein n=1 Tax=unclassified Oscillibacter TaxID=2629304 RepID=UPI0025ED1E37|nr:MULTISPECIES: hypothetical protein [unclassified Oscillibacter]